MAAFLLTPGVPIRATDANDDPVSGAKLYVFDAGTSTPVTVYQDIGLVTPHATPVVADANGYFAPIYFNGPDSVKVRIDDASDQVLTTQDNLTGLPTSTTGAADTGFSATARIPADDVQEAIEDVDRYVEKTQAGFDRIVTTGASNAYVLDTAVSSYTAYASGDVFLIEANHANTGAATLNVDALGAKAIKFRTGGVKVDPNSGYIDAGHILRVEYDGTDFVVIDHWRPFASQALAEAGTSPSYLMSPLRTQQAIAALETKRIKAWAYFNGTGTPAIVSGYNVTSITDISAGTYGVNFTTAMSDANYGVVATAQGAIILGVSNRATTSVRVTTYNTAGSNVDTDGISILVLG